MKIRLPAKLSLFAVPVVCLLLLAAAWALIMGGGGGSDEPAPSVVRVLCEESLQPPISEIVAAYERRGMGRIEAAFVSSAALAARLEGETRYDLLLLDGDDPAAAELIRRELVVPQKEVRAEAVQTDVDAEGATAAVRAFALPKAEAPELAAGFARFLTGLFAAEILQRYRLASV
ncbi:MAG: substrate-binding domain-containing protein [Verrucomicrobiales bacterium]